MSDLSELFPLAASGLVMFGIGFLTSKFLSTSAEPPSRHIYDKHDSQAQFEKTAHCSSAVEHFPGAVPQSKILKLVLQCLKKHNFTKDNILFATSCCPDEINRDLDEEAKDLGRAFCMGGLAGFPFVGKTGFSAFMHHVPADGGMLIICASHVGIDEKGAVGKVHRLGMKDDTSACGAAVGAYKYCEAHPGDIKKIAEGDPTALPAFKDDLDSQMNYIFKIVAKNFDKIKISKEPMAELARVCSEQIKADLKQIIPHDAHFPLAILQGIQINFEGANVGEDYFCPLSFSLYHGTEVKEDFLPTLLGIGSVAK